MSLVEKGVLKDFLRTRQPVRGYNDSNGHARLNGSYGADVAVAHQPDDHSARNQLDCRSQEEADRSLPISAACLTASSSARWISRRRRRSTKRAASSAAAAGGPAVPVSMPLYVYRLYTDGHEELVRGERLHGRERAFAQGHSGAPATTA